MAANGALRTGNELQVRLRARPELQARPSVRHLRAGEGRRCEGTLRSPPCRPVPIPSPTGAAGSPQPQPHPRSPLLTPPRTRNPTALPSLPPPLSVPHLLLAPPQCRQFNPSPLLFPPPSPLPPPLLPSSLPLGLREPRGGAGRAGGGGKAAPHTQDGGGGAGVGARDAL